MLALFRRSCNVQSTRIVLSRHVVSYVQGQSPAPKVREYFYYIDHQGQLFLDDTKVKNFITCFKDKQFLKFFFKRLKQNQTKYQEDFPFISPCGREMNYIRCDDLPVVFSTIIEDSDDTSNSPGLLTYSGIGETLTFPFEPEKVCMLPESGRIYHPGPEKVGGAALIKSSLAIEMSPHFEYRKGNQENDPPTHFNWKGKLL
ncbi:hypothetical protein OS493_030289 [Desmophyllum pertusum]|uniref:Uncharacterized protein n=1 Tax=Desmophyllum pertusum TaxID=174260 RepID=A0A9W9ZNC5_9CNID|nr:hypothetical protein OS493_030289 [Desmophyllum pertusum]